MWALIILGKAQLLNVVRKLIIAAALDWIVLGGRCRFDVFGIHIGGHLVKPSMSRDPRPVANVLNLMSIVKGNLRRPGVRRRQEKGNVGLQNGPLVSGVLACMGGHGTMQRLGRVGRACTSNFVVL